MSYRFIKFMRIIMLILTAAFNLTGFLAGIAVMLLFLLLNRTLSGESYLYPLLPLDFPQLMRRVFRKRIHFKKE